MNFFKVKTIKGLAKLQVDRLEKQNSRKIPFYSVKIIRFYLNFKINN